MTPVLNRTDVSLTFERRNLIYILIRGNFDVRVHAKMCILDDIKKV